jgi:hypothetical protein|eukprot:COSAG01_NODE_4175_length_5267_cov_1109.517608_6_plen_82_part_00
MEILREARKVRCLLAPRAPYSALRAVCCLPLAVGDDRCGDGDAEARQDERLGMEGGGPDEKAMLWSRSESLTPPVRLSQDH